MALPLLPSMGIPSPEMISLNIQISGNGPAIFHFESGTVLAVHLMPPPDGGNLTVVFDHLQATTFSVRSNDGGSHEIRVDIAEGIDPLWLKYTIDCTAGGSVSVGFPGSPTVRVNSGSFLGLEYDNGRSALPE